MSKEDDIKFLKIQTCVLKVNIHCDGCKQKVKKLLQKVDGVFQTSIDAEQGRVTVSGDVDPAELVKKLNKAGKYAEVLHQKGGSKAQLQKAQQNNTKNQQNKDCGKTPKGGVIVGGDGDGGGGGGGGKAQKALQTSFPQLHQMKGFKDLKLPQLKDLKLPFHKDPKSVKFTLPPEGGDDGSDYDVFEDDGDDDFDDDDLDEFDSFDADFDDDFRSLKLKPGSAQHNASNGIPMTPDNKSGKKGGCVEIPVQIKGMNGNNDPKNGKKGAGNQSQGGGGKNAGKAGAGGGATRDAKNVGSNGIPKPNANVSKRGVAGGGGGGGKNEGASAAAAVGAPFRPPVNFQPGMNVGQMGLMPPSGHPSGAVQGLPARMAPQGYYPGGGMPAMTPEMMASVAGGSGGGGPDNPYQQQYMAALMQQQQQQQQQQQRMMMMNQDRGYPPMMGYPRPPPPAMYVPQAQSSGEPYTNYFSDENANSCSIM